MNLIDAVVKNNYMQILYLVRSGADVNFQTDGSYTALMYASKFGNLIVVKYLVMNGAHINVLDFHDWCPLMFACWKGHLDIAKYLVRNGADINIQGNNQWTPLMMAALYDHVEIVKYLVQCGADRNMVGSWGECAYDIAMKEKCYEIASYIKYYPSHRVILEQLIPKLAPRISLSSCARIYSFM